MSGGGRSGISGSAWRSILLLVTFLGLGTGGLARLHDLQHAVDVERDQLRVERDGYRTTADRDEAVGRYNGLIGKYNAMARAGGGH